MSQQTNNAIVDIYRRIRRETKAVCFWTILSVVWFLPVLYWALFDKPPPWLSVNLQNWTNCARLFSYDQPVWTRIAIEITENQGETWLQLDQKLAPDEMFLSRPGVERWIEFQTANYQNLAALTRDRIKESQKTKVTGVRFVEYEQSVTGDIGNVRIVYEKVWTD